MIAVYVAAGLAHMAFTFSFLVTIMMKLLAAS